MTEPARHQVDEDRYVHNTVDGEVLVIDTEGGAYFSLRGAGALIWPLLVAGLSRAEAVAACDTLFDTPTEAARTEIGALFDRLEAEGVLRPARDGGTAPASAPASTPASAPATAVRHAYSPPILERYDDMRDLLTLDPIHEVTDSGWPDAQR